METTACGLVIRRLNLSCLLGIRVPRIVFQLVSHQLNSQKRIDRLKMGKLLSHCSADLSMTVRTG